MEAMANPMLIVAQASSFNPMYFKEPLLPIL